MASTFGRTLAGRRVPGKFQVARLNLEVYKITLAVINMQKHYLKDRPAFDSLSREWPASTPEPPGYPCFVCWAWVEGITGMWVTVEYVTEEDFRK